MKDSYLILDMYVDEPACFGVPPFVSPYPRYLYGALIDAGVAADAITYLTIDVVRENEFLLDSDYSQVFVIGGAIVPGRYLGQKIGTVAELNRIIQGNKRQTFAIGGMIAAAVEPSKRAIPVDYDIEAFAWEYARNTPTDRRRHYEELHRWAIKGAAVVRHHPSWPMLIAELETGRGCPRRNHCSFCAEGLVHNVEWRAADSIIEETDALIDAGLSRVRLGRQADLLQYGSDITSYQGEFPKPNPSALKELMLPLQRKREDGMISLLNMDNANPGTIAAHPAESEEILHLLTDTLTTGDTMAFGVESFDERVVSLNNLKVNQKEAREAVRLVNRIGGIRRDGIPALLPGINLLQGLEGESSETFRINYEALKEMKEEGLLLRRINIRTLQLYPRTPLAMNPPRLNARIRNRFEYYRDKIRDEIDSWMLNQVYPAGTLLHDVLVAENRGNYSMARQLASYAITVHLPLSLEVATLHTVIVTGHRERSLAALPFPVPVNRLDEKGLSYIPGISRHKARDMVLARPFREEEEIIPYLQDTPSELKGQLRWDFS